MQKIIKEVDVFGTIGWPEIIVILVIALLLFGAKRLPEVGRSLGKGIKEFKKAMRGISMEEGEEEEEKSKEEKE